MIKKYIPAIFFSFLVLTALMVHSYSHAITATNLGEINNFHRIYDMAVGPDGRVYIASASQVLIHNGDNFSSRNDLTVLAGGGDQLPFNPISDPKEVQMAPVALTWSSVGDLYIFQNGAGGGGTSIEVLKGGKQFEHFAGNGHTPINTPIEDGMDVSNSPLPVADLAAESLAVDQENNVYFNGTEFENRHGVPGSALYKITPKKKIYRILDGEYTDQNTQVTVQGISRFRLLPNNNFVIHQSDSHVIFNQENGTITTVTLYNLRRDPFFISISRNEIIGSLQVSSRGFALAYFRFDREPVPLFFYDDLKRTEGDFVRIEHIAYDSIRDVLFAALTLKTGEPLQLWRFDGVLQSLQSSIPNYGEYK